MKKITCLELPEYPAPDTIYELMPVNFTEADYYERTDRNIGILTLEQQNAYKNTRVGIAGCGGMGGYIAEDLIRGGVTTLLIADLESYDRSNIGRQFAATVSTIGKSKAFETARRLRAISNDTTIIVFPMGIRRDIVEQFVSGCDVIIDEIEFWELEAAIILHSAARTANIPIFGGNSAGFGTHLFFFTPTSITIEEIFDTTLTEARLLDTHRKNGTLSIKKHEELTDRLLLVVCPELKLFHQEEFPRIRHRLLAEGKASIFSSNPKFAAGYLGDKLALHCIGSTVGKPIPSMPGYGYMDARHSIGFIVEGKWW